MVIDACNPTTLEIQTGGSGVQGQSGLHSEFETRLGYMRLFLTHVVFFQPIRFMCENLFYYFPKLAVDLHIDTGIVQE